MSIESYIAEAAKEHGLSDKLIRAVIDAESSGNQDAVSPAGAIGLMQLMPGTAADLGVNPYDPRDNVRGGAKYLRQMLDRYGGDVQMALAAYNAGPAAVDKHQGIPPYKETQEYVQKIVKALGGGSYALEGLFDRTTDPFGAWPSAAEDKPITSGPGFLTEAKDKFLNQFYDNTTTGLARILWSSIVTSGHRAPGAPGLGEWEPSAEDFEFVQKILPGDFTAQKFVLMNANSREQLQYLAHMKKEDIERAQRVDSYGYGVSTLASITGALLDPLNLIPLGQEAKAVKLLSKFIPGQLINTSKAVKWGLAAVKHSEIAATQAAIMAADRQLADRYTGYHQDPEVAAKYGALAGFGLSLLGDLGRAAMRSKEAQRAIAALNNMEDHAYAAITGAKLPQAVKNLVAEDFLKVHDAAFIEASGNHAAKDLAKGGKLFAISKADAKVLADQAGVKLRGDARAFYDPNTGLTAIIKDNIPEGANLKGLIDHEIGVHKGLKALLGEPAYNKVMADISKRIEKGEFADIVRTIQSTNPEEVLGHWIEKNAGKDKLLDTVTTGVRKGLKKLGLTDSFSDGELKDLVRRAVEVEVDKARGYTVLPDGAVVMDGLRYSADSITNPHTWSDHFDLMPDVRKEAQGVGGWRGWLGQKLETWGPFATIHGTLKNSVSPLARQAADTLFHDARQRVYKGELVMSVEKMKEEIKGKLIGHWTSYMETRNQYIFGDNIKDYIGNAPNIRNFHARSQEFNRLVRECYNATYTTNKSGLQSLEWDPAIKKAAGIIKDLRDRIIEIGQSSSSMFGTKASNMLGPDWKTWDDELWRIMDDDKWTNFLSRFRDEDHAISFLTDYANKAVKRDVLKEKLLDQRQKEWEVDKKKYDKDMERYQKDLDEFKAKKAEWDQKVKDYETGLQEYAVKKQEWEVNGKKGDAPKKPSRPRGKAPTAPRKPAKLRDKPEDVDPQDLDQYILNEINDWTTGVVKRDHNNIELIMEGGRAPSHLPYLNERLPLDTTFKMDTPWGETFSFDAQDGVLWSLRDDNLDRIIPKVIDRFSGEAALRNVFSSHEKLKEARAKIQSQLEYAVAADKLSQKDMDKTLLAFDEGIDHIRGVMTKRQRTQNGLGEAFGRMFQSLAYSQSGGNMGWNQVGEAGVTIGHLGGKAVFHVVPLLDKLVRNITDGKVKMEYLQDGVRMLYGDTAERFLWSNVSSFESRLFKEATARGAMLRVTDKVNTGLNYAARLTSELNFLPRLTDAMLRSVRRDALGDAVAWAYGAKFSKLRDPFSDVKLKAAGVDADMVKTIRDDIRKYTEMDADGTPIRTDWETWAKESPTSFYKFKFLIDQHAMRAIQQDSIGNRAMLKDAGVGYRILLQFKDFTLKATNGQTMRFLTNPEWDTGMAALYSMATNAGVFALLTGLRAYAYFPNDEKKRKEYLESRMTPGNLVMAGFLRGAITGAAFSFAQDAYEAWSGDPLFRTTVDRTYQFGRNKDRDAGDVFGDYIEQLPTVRAAWSVAESAKLGYKAVAPWERVTKRDLQAFERAFPLANWIPAAYIAAEVNDAAGLPDRLPKDNRPLIEKIKSMLP